MSGKSAFQIFAEYGGKQHALAERKKRFRGQADAFPELSGNEDPTGDERYTTRETMLGVLAMVGIEGFDLDVAACAESNWGKRYYDKTQNALLLAWFVMGVRWCWMNPPYSDLAPWFAHTWVQMETCPRGGGVVALIPATRTEQAWWQRDIEPYRDGGAVRIEGVTLTTRFLAGRTSFARPGSNGVGQSGAPFGCVLLTFRRAA